MISEALEALRRAGVEFTFRKGPTSDEELPEGGEIDLGVERSQLPALDRALVGAGLFRLAAPGHLDHHFYLGFEDGRWLKVDVKTPSTLSGGLRRRIARSFGIRRPVTLRRAGPLVAVVGPDGAGKGSVIAALERRIPLGVVVAYFGGPKKDGEARAPTVSPDKARREAPLPHPARETAWVVLRWARAWRRLLGAYGRAWRGLVVVCDRYPLEVLATKPRRTKLGAPVERFLFGRLWPRPDALIVLDAPGEVLFARKGEHSPEILDRWRGGYREALVPLGAYVVSTEGPIDESVAKVSGIVWEALRARRRW